MSKFLKIASLLALGVAMTLGLIACLQTISLEPDPEPGSTTRVIPITSIDMTIIEPVKGATQRTDPGVAHLHTNTTISDITWHPTHSPPIFQGETEYTISFILKPNQGYVFGGLSAKIDGKEATISNYSINQVTLSLTFPKTADRTIKEIIVTAPSPAIWNLNHGHVFNEQSLANLEFTIVYSDDTTELGVTALDFDSHGFTTTPPMNTTLEKGTHDGDILLFLGSTEIGRLGHLNVLPIPPSAPLNFSATAGDARITLSWDPPTNQGSSVITGYEVTRDNGTTWSTLIGPGTSHIFTGLINGTSYTVGVRAINSDSATVGPGPWEFRAVTPTAAATVPGVPQGLAASPGNQQVALSWTEGATGGSAITGYKVSSDNGSTWLEIGVTTNYTFTDLDVGTQYIFHVRAVNAIGEGPSAIQTATTWNAPSIPKDFEAITGDTFITLSWSAPADDGGSAVTRYEVQINDETWINKYMSTSHTFTGLTNGTSYTVRVRAVNNAGDGVVASVKSTPRTVPGAPTIISAIAGDEAITLSWSAPADDGGSAVTKYEVQLNSGSWIDKSFGTSHIFTDLTNGTSYTVSVRAVNAAGNGAEASATAIPIGVPEAPQNFKAVPGNGQVVLTWEAPDNDGGKAIMGYEVTIDDGNGFTTSVTKAEDEFTHTFTGLANGTEYTFQVLAVNNDGEEGDAATITSTPRTVPDMPEDFKAVAGETFITLSWKPPTFNGGSPIINYEVTKDGGAIWGPAASDTGHTFEDLDSDTSYDVGVRAVNAAGEGAEYITTVTTLTDD
ncbi:MAG: fibronectin type III domain-containing protein [Treponema sp.]|nr:fibronectin type III domain-containing protein [Treponema sp.]